jgi:hypothetical protein
VGESLQHRKESLSQAIHTNDLRIISVLLSCDSHVMWGSSASMQLVGFSVEECVLIVRRYGGKHERCSRTN